MIPIVYGTFIMTAISILPLINVINLFCCAGIMLGGLAGVFIYNKQLTGTELKLTSKDGVMIGVLCGILSGILVAVFNFVVMVVSKHNPIDEMMTILDKFSLPPEVIQEMNKFSEEYNNYGFSPTISLVSIFSNLVIYPLFGMIGAVLGVTIINKKKQKLTN